MRKATQPGLKDAIYVMEDLSSIHKCDELALKMNLGMVSKQSKKERKETKKDRPLVQSD